MRKLSDFKLATNKVRRGYLVNDPNYHTTIVFSENVLLIEMKRTQILMIKPVYLGLYVLVLL